MAENLNWSPRVPSWNPWQNLIKNEDIPKPASGEVHPALRLLIRKLAVELEAFPSDIGPLDDKLITVLKDLVILMFGLDKGSPKDSLIFHLSTTYGPEYGIDSEEKASAIIDFLVKRNILEQVSTDYSKEFVRIKS